MKLVSTIIQKILPLMLTATVSAQADALLTTQMVLESASASDWRVVSQDDLLYMQLETGQVVFELAPAFAPEHRANIRQLVRDHYFDGLSIVRSQDNYVVQWGDAKAGKEGAKDLGKAKGELEAEFFRERKGLEIVPLTSRDAYADEVGFVDGFPVASDGKRAWLTHCYGMLGVGRDVASNSGNGAELYVVTGHAPRHLDRNVTLIGRVVKGIEILSSLPRGTGELGFYESEDEYARINSIRFGDELPESDSLKILVMKTDSPTFRDFVQSRTFRRESWFVDPAGRIELCNVAVPVRIDSQD